MKTSFQAGVDTLYGKCNGLGFTPAGKTPSQISDAIQKIYTDRYNSGYTSGKNDYINYYYNSRYTEGYNAGVTAGKSEASGEIVFTGRNSGPTTSYTFTTTKAYKVLYLSKYVGSADSNCSLGGATGFASVFSGGKDANGKFGFYYRNDVPANTTITISGNWYLCVSVVGVPA